MTDDSKGVCTLDGAMRSWAEVELRKAVVAAIDPYASTAQNELARRRLRPERPCTVCALRGQRVGATHVAASADGTEWYECGEHGPDDHIALGERRVGLVPIADWFRRMPGYR